MFHLKNVPTLFHFILNILSLHTTLLILGMKQICETHVWSNKQASNVSGVKRGTPRVNYHLIIFRCYQLVISKQPSKVQPVASWKDFE